jgi:hypothetical protein
MAKKKITPTDFDLFKSLHKNLVSIPTWTKEKHECKKKLMEFLSNFHYSSTNRKCSFPKFTNGNRFRNWDVEVVKIPKNNLGCFYSYVDKTVLIMCIDHQWTGIELIVFPVEGEWTFLYEFGDTITH